jgi:rod shape-determining protein MreD
MSSFLRKAAIAVLIFSLLLFQLPLTRYVPWLSMLDLPLVCVLYLTIFKESLFWMVLAGTGVGLLQDSMSLGAMGMHGFTVLSIGFLVYLANSVFAIDRLTTRWAMLFLSSTMALLLSFLLRVLFLNRDEMIDVRLLLLSGVLNACIGLFVFYLLDRMIRPVKS